MTLIVRFDGLVGTPTAEDEHAMRRHREHSPQCRDVLLEAYRWWTFTFCTRCGTCKAIL